MTPNPNRLAGSPALGEPALGLAPVAVVERSPTGLALLPQVAVKIATVVVGLAAIGVVVFTSLMPAAGATIAATATLATTGLVGVSTSATLTAAATITAAGSVTGALDPAPASMTLTVAPEDRVLAVGAEDRLLYVHPEDRTLTVEAT